MDPYAAPAVANATIAEPRARTCEVEFPPRFYYRTLITGCRACHGAHKKHTCSLEGLHFKKVEAKKVEAAKKAGQKAEKKRK